MGNRLPPVGERGVSWGVSIRCLCFDKTAIGPGVDKTAIGPRVDKTAIGQAFAAKSLPIDKTAIGPGVDKTAIGRLLLKIAWPGR